MMVWILPLELDLDLEMRGVGVASVIRGRITMGLGSVR
jgi:hypothetical protein